MKIIILSSIIASKYITFLGTNLWKYVKSSTQKNIKYKILWEHISKIQMRSEPIFSVNS